MEDPPFEPLGDGRTCVAVMTHQDRSAAAIVSGTSQDGYGYAIRGDVSAPPIRETYVRLIDALADARTSLRSALGVLPEHCLTIERRDVDGGVWAPIFTRVDFPARIGVDVTYRLLVNGEPSDDLQHWPGDGPDAWRETEPSLQEQVDAVLAGPPPVSVPFGPLSYEETVSQRRTLGLPDPCPFPRPTAFTSQRRRLRDLWKAWRL